MNTTRSLVMTTALLVAVLLTGTGCTKAIKAKRHLARGDRDFAAGQYEKAEIEYLIAMRAGNMHPVAVRQLGIIYYEQGRLGRAFSFLHKAAEVEPDNVEVRRRLGVVYLALRQLKEANEEAVRVLAKEPGNEDALLMLAESATDAKTIEETRQRLEALRQQDKDRPGYHLALASLHFRGKDFVKAETEIKAALAMDPKSSGAHIALGNLNLVKGDLKQAEPLLKTGSELAPIRSAARLKYAEFKLKTGATDEAKKLFEEVAQKIPDYLPVTSYLMQVAFVQKRFDDCTTLVKRILAVDPMNYDAAMTGGRLSLLKNDGDQAILDFQRMIPTFEKMPDVHYQLALAYLLKDDTAKAMSSLNQALLLKKDYPDAILLMSVLNAAKGNAVASIGPLTQLVKQHPEFPKAHLLLAGAHMTEKNYDEAAAVYRQMISLFPKSAEVPALLGAVLVRQNKMTEARKAFEDSLTLSPDFYPAIEQLVFLDLAEKQYESASKRASQQMEKYPKAPEPVLLMAAVYVTQGATNQAEASMLKAIELKPDFRKSYVMLADFYLSQKKTDEAIAKLAALTARRTNDVNALMQLGTLQEGTGKLAEGRSTYERILKVAPDFIPALNNLAYLYSESFGLLDPALELAERARKLQPNDPATVDTVGWILFKKGEFSKALPLLQESAAKLPAQPEVQLHLGATYYMLGQEGQAQAALQRAVSAKDDFSGKEKGRQMLAILAIDPKTAGGDVLSDLEKRRRENPKDPAVLARLAAIYERDGNVEKATEAYEAVLTGNPQHLAARLHLADHYGRTPQGSAKALEMLKEARQLAPEEPNIAYRLGRLIYAGGDFRLALSLLQESSGKLPDNPEVSYDLALASYAVGQIAEAQAAAQRALQNPSFSRADEARRFSALIGAQDPAQAQALIAEARQILSTNANHIPALMISATGQKSQGNFSDAIQTYEKVLAANPLFTPAARELALLQAAHPGDDKKAYASAAKVRLAYPNDSELAKATGILAYRCEDYRRAVELLRESSDQRKNDAEVLYYLGMSHYRLKQAKESKESLQRALALNVGPQLASEAQRVIAELK